MAREISVPTGTLASSATRLIQAPANAHLRIASLSGYTESGNAGVLWFFAILPPSNTGNNFAIGASGVSSYGWLGKSIQIEGTSSAAPLSISNAGMVNQGELWIPAGWTLAVYATSTSTGVAHFNCCGMIWPATTEGNFRV